MQRFNNFFERVLSEIKSRNVKLVANFFIFAITSMLLISFHYLFNISSEYNIKQFFPQNHPTLIQDKRVIEHFKLQERSSAVLVVNFKNNSLNNVQALKQIRDLTLHIQTLPFVQQAFSIGNLQGTYEVAHNIYVGDLFDQVPSKYWTNLVKNHPFASPLLLSYDKKDALVAIELKENTPQAVQKLKDDLSSYNKSKLPLFKFSIGGVPIIQSEVAKLLRSELARSVLLGLLIFIFVMSFIFKDWSGLVISLSTLFLVNILTLGIVGFLKINFDILLSTLPIIVSLATISLSTQILIRINSEVGYASSNIVSKFKSILYCYRHLFLENLLACLTTTIGFLMLVFSDVSIINKYGKTVALVILASWFLTHLVLVPLLFYLPKVELRKWSATKALWSLPLLRFKKLFVGLGFAVYFLGFASIPYLNWNSRLFDDLPKESLSRINTEKIDRKLGGTIPISIVLFGEKRDWAEPTNIKNLNLLSEELKKYNSVGSVVSTSDFFKKISNKGQRIPASTAENKESLFVFSMAEKDPTASFLNQQFNLVRLEVRFKDFSSDLIDKDVKNIKYAIQKYFPGIKYNISGMGITAHELNSEMAKDLLFGFWQSLALITFILIFIFRSFKWAVVAFLPNLIPPTFLILLLAITKTPIKPGVAIIFSIAVGLAFTNTVYLIGQLRKLIKERDLKHYLPIKQMLLTEMVPCLMSSLLVTSAFLVFAFSYFEMNKIFGVYMIASILAGAFGDLVFLPSFVSTFSKYLLTETKKKKTQLTQSKIVASFSVFFLILIIGINSSADTDVKLLLNKAKSLISSKDDTADVVMKIIEKDGSVKERKLVIKRKNSNKHMTLVKLKSPQDLKGTALLSIIEKGEQSQWLYLPSTKQVRRVMGQNKKAGVLGSELTADDLDITTVKGANVHLVKEMEYNKEKYALIEVKSNSNKTQYSKALILISLKNNLPVRLEYYDKQNKAIKRVDFENYTLSGGVYRAQSIKIKNLVNKRGTDLILSNVKSNSGLSDDEFTQRALSRN